MNERRTTGPKLNPTLFDKLVVDSRALDLVDHPQLPHPRQHVVAPLPRQPRVEDGVVGGGRADQPRQQRALPQVQVLRRGLCRHEVVMDDLQIVRG